MSSLLDEPDVDFVVVVNDEQQHSRWPAPVAVPGGGPSLTVRLPRPTVSATCGRTGPTCAR